MKIMQIRPKTEAEVELIEWVKGQSADLHINLSDIMFYLLEKCRSNPEELRAIADILNIGDNKNNRDETI